uniref:RRM domain-containing protein n=1 Tax=Angiostrongylus cantonensis TaxID=6313 RepID=A0A0K0CYY5_ANGCA
MVRFQNAQLVDFYDASTCRCGWRYNGFELYNDRRSENKDQTGPRPYDTVPRFFGGPPPRNSSTNVNRSITNGMTRPHRVMPPQQHLADEKRATVPVKDGSQLPPHLRPPYGIPPTQLRGSSQLSTPATRKSPGGPHPLIPPSDSRNRPNGGHTVPPGQHNRQQASSIRPFSSGVNSWRGDNRPPPSSNGSSSWDANVQKNDWRNKSSPAPPHRKPLISQPPTQGFYKESQKPGVSPCDSAPSRPLIPPRLPKGPSANESSISRTPLLGPNFGGGPNVPSGPRYVELSRLPTETLHPAVLEQFLKPSVPLQISSVKVVYSSQGIHMHTLVRFEKASDAESVLKRDGELGIRVRPSTKVDFEQAVDGPPSGVIVASEAVDNGDRKRDSEPSRRRSRSRSRERRRTKRDSPPRKRQRSQSRSRERRSVRGSRSHSLKRSRQTTSSTRWCLQLTNVPFRCSEAEIIETVRQLLVCSWLSERVRPSKVTRTFYADGNASDRWIAEFESESLMERAQGIKRLLMGRTVKMCHIDNDHADELMKIEDVYGERRKEDNEKMMIDVSHFNPPPARGRAGGSVFFPAPARGATSFGRGSHHGSSLISVGGPGMRGRGMGRGFSSFSHEGGTRGRGRGAFGGRGGMYTRESKFAMRSDRDAIENVENHKSDLTAPRSPEPEPVAATDDFVASLGPRGTVLSCCGFPSNVTMEDVLSFFRGYPVDHNSVRIRMGDDGIPTGECMLAMANTEAAKKAVLSLSGNSLRGQAVSLQLANP